MSRERLCSQARTLHENGIRSPVRSSLLQISRDHEVVAADIPISLSQSSPRMRSGSPPSYPLPAYTPRAASGSSSSSTASAAASSSQPPPSYSPSPLFENPVANGKRHSNPHSSDIEAQRANATANATTLPTPRQAATPTASSATTTTAPRQPAAAAAASQPTRARDLSPTVRYYSPNTYRRPPLLVIIFGACFVLLVIAFLGGSEVRLWKVCKQYPDLEFCS